ncbi:hypothetical protein [Paractinoplanes brasiliensis]|uniref:Uncharacterized protein n=1 Tax=Paractinoplanes brasiliensis TaxID=52695 RepID=A0A4R6JBN7_9ACTN|nr:hypothetical protein [Actinoplanes brasiliensis]TDO32952.1 hypothetical protein C8E87_8431 [Actinoplanes brasiliensis]GID28669.1 hypothetical protein Abr02nite_36520 [Actinoplanes brasiliensis]
MNRYVGVAAILLTVAAGVVVMRDSGEDLPAQVATRMRETLEQADPQQHSHGGHSAPPTDAKAEVICGVRVYGYEPSDASTLTGVRTVYGFHFCGVAEDKTPWDVAVKLAGPVIVDLSAQPAGIQVVEATAEVKYIDRLREMFPAKYAELAQKEALTEAEMTDLRERYDSAAGL